MAAASDATFGIKELAATLTGISNSPHDAHIRDAESFALNSNSSRSLSWGQPRLVPSTRHGADLGKYQGAT
jgi:hypothetical protein